MLICARNYKQIARFHGQRHSRRHQLPVLITCKFCVEDLFVLLPDLLLVVFQQPLAQVAHLLQCKRRLVLSRGTWWTEPQMSRGLTSGSSRRTGWQQGNTEPTGRWRGQLWPRMCPFPRQQKTLFLHWNGRRTGYTMGCIPDLCRGMWALVLQGRTEPWDGLGLVTPGLVDRESPAGVACWSP